MEDEREKERERERERRTAREGAFPSFPPSSSLPTRCRLVLLAVPCADLVWRVCASVPSSVSPCWHVGVWVCCVRAIVFVRLRVRVCVLCRVRFVSFCVFRVFLHCAPAARASACHLRTGGWRETERERGRGRKGEGEDHSKAKHVPTVSLNKSRHHTHLLVLLVSVELSPTCVFPDKFHAKKVCTGATAQCVP